MGSVLACGTMGGPALLLIAAFVFAPMCLSVLGFFTWMFVKLRHQTPYSLRSVFVWMTIIGLNFAWLSHWFI